MLSIAIDMIPSILDAVTIYIHIHVVEYLCHVVTSVEWLPTTAVWMNIELSEVVEGNDSIEVDDHTRHEHCHQ